MKYQFYLYIFFSMLSAFALSGVDFQKFMKPNKYWESRILAILLALALGYIITNLIVAFL